jgi:hypothetical protein
MAMQTTIYEQELNQEIHEIPKEYWPNLLQILRLFRESVTLQPAEASFRRGWEEAMAGQASAVSKLWEN